MRLSQSGTFIHGNYWYNRGTQPFGSQGTSHGCVGLADAQGAQGDTPGKWFYDHSLIGDVVIVERRTLRTTPSAGQRPQRLEHALERVDRPSAPA
ncbi:hypothetical protein SVIOM342S_03264 [Streptomyces violaceorubidus]